jgi:hypothetical protein
MDFASLLLPAAAIGATILTGGAAAPGLAAATGGAEAAAAGGTAAAAGAEAAAASAAASEAAMTAGTGAGAGAMAAPVAANPLEFGSVINPAASTGQVAATGGQALPMGMTSAPGMAPGATPALGSGVSGTGSFATMPGQGAPAVAGLGQSTGLTAQQVAQLGKMVTGSDGQQQQRAPVAGGSASAGATNRAQSFQQMSTQPVGQRASLGQLLYGKH